MTRLLSRAAGPLALVAALASAPAARAQTPPESALDSLAMTADTLAAAADSLAAAAREQSRRDSLQAVSDSLAALLERREQAQVEYDAGTALLQQENFAEAMVRFDAGLAIDSTNFGSQYGRAFALAQLGRADEALPAFDRAIRLAEAADDTTALGLARTSREGVANQMAAAAAAVYVRVDSLLNVNPLTREAAEQALPLLADAEAGGAPADLAFHYRYARALNAAERFAAAADHAQQAVEMSTGEADRSAYYYELGLALKGMNQNGQALDAFEEAKTGTWAGWAEYQIGVINAGGAAPQN